MTTNDIAVTNVKGKNEFDYPISTTLYETNEYQGKGGINANLFDRLVLALSEQDYKLVFNSNVDESSKILLNRNIRERAKVLLPYLLYDEEPYMVIREDGQLVWVLDAYTVSNSYPFSQKTNIEFEGKYKEIMNWPIGRTRNFIQAQRENGPFAGKRRDSRSCQRKSARRRQVRQAEGR